MTPGPTPVPPEVLAAMAEPVVHHRSPDFRVVLERCLGRLAQVFRTEVPVLMFTSSGTAAMESAVANLVSPGDRVTVVSCGYFGERWQSIASAYGARRRCARVRVGRGAVRRRARGATGRATGEGRVPHALGDLDRRRRRRARAGRRREGGRCARRRRRDLEPRRRAARVRRVGDRRRLLRLAEGADDATRARVRLRLGRSERRAWNLAALLPRLGAHTEGPGEARRSLHARGLDHRGPRRRARAAARRRSRVRVRAARAPRPRVQGGREGDGPRALLAGRRQLGRRDRDSRARRHRLRRRRARAPRQARDHDRQRPGRAQGADLPDRPHRLVRRVRHHDRARRGRALARGAGRGRRARRRHGARARGLRRRPAFDAGNASWSASPSPTRA